ncbi:MAG: N-acyl homoserine lactonase family protein [Rhodospirillales bacterium]|jgi:glyoxylase-like metal-dependent hydrolase (beta-lactamase superfamily II)
MSKIWKIYGIRYAKQNGRLASHTFLWGSPDEELAGLDYYSWVLVSDDRAIVVDTGGAEHKIKGLGRQWIASPLDGLKQLGVDPSNVEDVIVSHAHWDHVGELAAFPKAHFYMNDLEMESITGEDMSFEVMREAYHAEEAQQLVGLTYEDRLTFLSGDGQFADGVDYTLIGGHSAGQMALTVQTERGPVVLATDAIHLWEEVEKERAFLIFHDLRQMLKGYRKMNQMVRGDLTRLLPGHDPLIKERYPVVKSMGDEPFILDLGGVI